MPGEEKAHENGTATAPDRVAFALPQVVPATPATGVMDRLFAGPTEGELGVAPTEQTMRLVRGLGSGCRVAS